MKRIALAGNPNSGKTTLFNLLTGSRQRVGNWPGVTVDKKEGYLRKTKDILIEDLPGIYSLSPYTLEEVVSRRYLVEQRPDLIVNLVDASNLTRNLYLTSQLMELNIPMILVLNMMDIVRSRKDEINVEQLKQSLNCEVIEITATKKEGIDELTQKIIELSNDSNTPNYLEFDTELERSLKDIEDVISQSCDLELRRYFSIKAFENDSKAIQRLNLNNESLKKIDDIRKETENKEDDIAESIITTQRYDKLEKIIEKVLKKAPVKLTTTDKIDKIVTNRILGLPIFAIIMGLVYYVSILTLGTGATDAVNGFFEDGVVPFLTEVMENASINPVIIGLVCDGAVAGVGAVLGFLPQMLVLFALLAILEDIGYMARVAFVMDRIFRRFGLSGKSFIPMMIGTGCSVPGIQASRTIENERDRKITIMTTSFMPCSAKLPVIALIAGSLFNNSTMVAVSMYFIGIASVIISGVILKKFKSLASTPAPFVMELPQYHAPRISSVLRDMFDKGWAFVKRAGSIIFVSSIIIWFLSNFDLSMHMVEENGEGSILANIGSIIAVIFKPLGFGTWQATVASITGFVAKENVVATMGVVLGLGSDVSEETPELLTAFSQGIGGAVGGYSFLLFNMLCMPCFAAVGAIRKEMNSAKWTWLTVAYLMGFAYVVSFIFYNLSRLILNGQFDIFVVIAIILAVAMLYLIFRKNKYVEEKYE